MLKLRKGSKEDLNPGSLACHRSLQCGCLAGVIEGLGSILLS